MRDLFRVSYDEQIRKLAIYLEIGSFNHRCIPRLDATRTIFA